MAAVDEVADGDDGGVAVCCAAATRAEAANRLLDRAVATNLFEVAALGLIERIPTVSTSASPRADNYWRFSGVCHDRETVLGLPYELTMRRPGRATTVASGYVSASRS